MHIASLSGRREATSMANTIKIDLSKELRSGKAVKCLECHQGVYKPVGTTAQKAHCFKCDKCGDHVHFTPSITVE